jgi:hypothetical protein
VQYKPKREIVELTQWCWRSEFFKTGDLKPSPILSMAFMSCGMEITNGNVVPKTQCGQIFHLSQGSMNSSPQEVVPQVSVHTHMKKSS